jgi:putative hydrolase of the HAD superfamily
MTRAIIFDVDDTLYLERDYVRSGFAAVSHHIKNQYGIPGFAEVAWRLFEDGLRGHIFDEALTLVTDEPGLVPIQELVGVYREHPPTIELLPDARTTLQELAEQDVPIGVITDGPAASQHAKVAALCMRGAASTVVVTADLGPGRGKPHEAAFREVEDALALSGSDLTYVADNPKKDFIAPKRRGWRTVRVRRHGGLHFAAASGTDVDNEADELSTDLLGLSLRTRPRDSNQVDR